MATMIHGIDVDAVEIHPAYLLSVTELVAILIHREKETNGFENPALTNEQLTALAAIIESELHRREFNP